MVQKQGHYIQQTEEQRQHLSQQQMLQVKMLEMPLIELEEKIHAEINDNPALEVGEERETFEGKAETKQDDNDSFEVEKEKEERQDALDDALERMRSDEELPVYDYRQRRDTTEYEEIVYGDTTSFIDKLNEQVRERELTDKQSVILDFLIGNLDDGGWLRSDLESIVDLLAIQYGVDCTEAEVEESLKILQEFDPPGIGARNLQECLLIQIERKLENSNSDTTTHLYQYLKTIVTDLFDAFTKKHWDKIKAQLELNDLQVEALQREIKKLNPKPGAAMGETMGRNTQQITPDFVVETDDEGRVSFTINQGRIPDLYISQTFSDMLSTYKEHKASMSRRAKEEMLYIQEKVRKAQGFIQAIKERQRTLFLTMQTIITIQKKFFQDGDEADLKPMKLKDIADKTGLDISTISRVSNIKYAQTRWGIFPLRFFFTDSYVTEEGEEMSTRKIKLALKELIDKEDKQKPLSDEMLAAVLKEQGYPIARRTVAKYREQLNLPVARLRKETTS